VEINSHFGVVMSKIQQVNEQEDQTIFQVKLTLIVKFITKLGTYVSSLAFVVLLLIWIVKISGTDWNASYLSELIEDLMICLVIFINKVFKVLPLTWVIFLNYSMKK
jgi:hypothetical protein